jgi:hypothetical protein
MGHDEWHPIEDISFENIKINGKKIELLEDFIIIDKKTTSGIKIH